ncbi:MAG: energy-coupling factor transporter transmembrane component T [Bacillota bacterium]
MFAYEYRDSYLNRLNPLTKLGAILMITIFVSIFISPLLPLATLIAAAALTCVCGKISLLELLRKMTPFLAVSLSFMFFMLLLKGIDNAQPDVRFLVFGWLAQDFYNILSLGLRILSISLMTLAFVITTDPNDLVLSLILQLKLSYVHGYAALAAYRFIPTLRAEIESIRLAQQIRGIEWEDRLSSRIFAPFRMLLPLLCSAARKGERVALAMDSRGLGHNRSRTFFKKTAFGRRDIAFLAFVAVFYLALGALLLRFGLMTFGSSLGTGLT